MMRKPQWFKRVEPPDIIIVVAAIAMVAGLALISIPAALIIPSVLILALGYLRKWY